MRIAVTGASGLVGAFLTGKLAEQGHSITKIVRKQDDSTSSILWDPARNEIDAAALEGHEVVIHLAGENVAAGRWTAQKKERILTSRTQGTTLLSQTLAQLKQPPRVLLSASAIGYYGQRPPDEPMDETNERGHGFLADVTGKWEESTQPAKAAGIRVVHMRFGIVLSQAGGALARMLPPFRLGLGGKIGDGKQMMSWIALDEIPLIVDHLIRHESIKGPVNVVSPQPVSNEVFTKCLSEVLRRPAFLPLPAFALRLAFGEMADSLLIGGTKVIPRQLQESRYTFSYPDLTAALRHILKNTQGN